MFVSTPVGTKPSEASQKNDTLLMIKKRFKDKHEKYISDAIVEVSLNFVSADLKLSPELQHVDHYVEKALELCSEILTKVTSPLKETLKMQAYFLENYLVKESILENQRRLLQTKLDDIVHKLRKLENGKSEEMQDYVVSYILLKSGLVHPMDLNVVSEITVTTDSVFPKTRIAEFITLDAVDIKLALNELSDIVTGITLFNKECGIGGAGVENLMSVLHEALLIGENKILDEIKRVSIKLYEIGDLWTKYSSRSSSGSISTLLDESVFNLLQYKIFLHQLELDFSSCAKRVKRQIEIFNTILQQVLQSQLYDTNSECASPTNSSFIILSNTWSSLQDEVIILSHLISMFYQLHSFTESSGEEFRKLSSKSMHQDTSDKSNKGTNEHDKVIEDTFSSFLPKMMKPSYCTTELKSSNDLLNKLEKGSSTKTKVSPHKRNDSSKCRKVDSYTQTLASNFRKEKSSQMLSLRCQGTQTRKDSSTNTSGSFRCIKTIFVPCHKTLT